MQINNSHTLSEAIGKLKAKKIIEEKKLLINLTDIKNYIDPVYIIKKILPDKKNAGLTFNTFIDETIMDAAGFINNKFSVKASDTFIKIAATNMLKNAIIITANKNKLSIKSLGLAIIKNLFN